MWGSFSFLCFVFLVVFFPSFHFFFGVLFSFYFFFLFIFSLLGFRFFFFCFVLYFCFFLVGVCVGLALGVCFRFRDMAPVDDDRPTWELGNAADGLVPLNADTERTAYTVKEHR